MTRPFIPTHRPDEAGVSNVLGAVMVFGLLVITLVVVQTKFVPVWDEDREARHMDLVANQLGAFVSDLGRMAGNQSDAGVTDPITLSTSEGFRFFKAPGGGMGELAFTPSATGNGFNVTGSPQLRIQTRNGVDLFGLGEQWSSVTSGGGVTDVLRVDHLRLRIDMNPGSYADGDSATLEIEDAQGNFAGKAVTTFRSFPSEDALETKIFNAANQEISSDIEAFFQQTNVEYFYVNLLDSALLFRSVLAGASTPFDLQLDTTGLTADYTLAASTVAGGSSGQGGLVVNDYALETESGSLSFASRNTRFSDQTYVVENGAVIVVQGDGAAMRIPPAVQVTANANQAVLSWTMPGLEGDSTALGGSTTASMVASPSGVRNEVVGTATRINVRVPTAYPAVWQTWLDEQMRSAGLSSSSGQYTITPAATSVTLTLYGPRSDATEDVVLALQQSTVHLTLRPSG